MSRACHRSPEARPHCRLLPALASPRSGPHAPGLSSLCLSPSRSLSVSCFPSACLCLSVVRGVSLRAFVPLHPPGVLLCLSVTASVRVCVSSRSVSTSVSPRTFVSVSPSSQAHPAPAWAGAGGARWVHFEVSHGNSVSVGFSGDPSIWTDSKASGGSEDTGQSRLT